MKQEMVFKLSMGSHQCQPTTKESLPSMSDRLNIQTIADNSAYRVVMIEDRSSDDINFFIKDGVRLFAIKGDVFFTVESGLPVGEGFFTNVLDNSIMGAVWKDKKLRHRSPKGFKWTDQMDKADDAIFDLELLNVV